VSVLPQLERDRSGAQARRRRRPFTGRGWAPVALAAAVTAAVVAAAAGMLRPGRRLEQPTGAAATIYRGRLEATYASGGFLYVWPFATAGPFRLVRIDPGSGAVVARFRAAPPATHSVQPIPLPEDTLLAGGSLWISASDGQRAWLWRLDPRSLAVRSRSLLPGGGANGSGSLAAAGGWLWVVNANTLVRMSLATGRVTGSRILSHAEAGLGNSIAADPGGRALVAVASGGSVRGRLAGSRVYRLDPLTGAPVAASPTIRGYTPKLAGVLDGGAWINGLTFTDGPARVDLRTMKVTATVGRFPQVAQVFNGIVEVDGNGASRCVDPVSGRVLAMLPAVVAANGTTAYVLRPAPGGGAVVRREALDPRCFARR
jgi:hypothetical protein